MYIVIRYDEKQGVEKIIDIVENYEDMVHYQGVLFQKDSSLRIVSSTFTESVHGRCVPFATTGHYSYYVQYQKAVKEPSF